MGKKTPRIWLFPPCQTSPAVNPTETDGCRSGSHPVTPAGLVVRSFCRRSCPDILTTLHNVGYQFRSPASRELLDRGIGRTLRLIRAHFLEAGLSVGHAGRCSFLHETLGEEGPVTMMFVGFQQKGRIVLRCLSGAGPFPDPCSSCSSGIAPCPDGRLAARLGSPK